MKVIFLGEDFNSFIQFFIPKGFLESIGLCKEIILR